MYLKKFENFDNDEIEDAILDFTRGIQDEGFEVSVTSEYKSGIDSGLKKVRVSISKECPGRQYRPEFKWLDIKSEIFRVKSIIENDYKLNSTMYLIYNGENGIMNVTYQPTLDMWLDKFANLIEIVIRFNPLKSD